MNLNAIVDRMDRFARALPALLGGIGREEALYRPNDTTWSILEIVCHLRDEEVLDFRPRLEHTLAEPQTEWDPIDPVALATTNNYRRADLEEATARFVAERQRSVVWLIGLGAVDWNRTYPHPRAGPVPAGDLLASWSAHDALHLRQIAKRQYELATVNAAGFDSGYAGTW
jgi:hypothetical protein